MKQGYFLFTFLFIFSFSQAQIVNIPDTFFKNRLISAGIDLNDDGEIQVSEAESITSLDVSDSFIADLTGIEAFVNLQELDCDNNELTSLDVSNLINLTHLLCRNNQLETLNVSGLTNLSEIACYYNQLTTLDVSGLTSLTKLFCYDNQLTSLNLNNLPNLDEMWCNNNLLTELNLSGLVSLETLECSNNQLSDLNLNGLTSLLYFYCDNNQLTSLSLGDSTSILEIACTHNLLSSLDFSQLNLLYLLYCNDNNLTELNIKNGSQIVNGSLFNFDGNYDLEFICVDFIELEQIQNLVDYYGYSNAVLNTYCSFVPGGEYYTVEGQNTIDLDLNGCGDANDLTYPNLKFYISDGINYGEVISNSSGDYFIPVQEGAYSITPILEITDYFSISPTNLVVDFPTDTNPYIQNFCISPNGELKDLEVVIIPLEEARPGFDTDYKIIYKNKGTTTQSGTVFFDFTENSGYMQFVSSIPVQDNLENDMLTWSYTNLQPFETREILLTLNMNAPSDTPPLNGGEDIGYVADIHPYLEDETPGDNNFQIKLTVVNSSDPNDITCLQGETITPEKVGDYVHYLIRFENTGTADAINIVVKDEIDLSKFDISTLVPLDGSHDFFTRIRDNNIVEFIFEDINLPFDDANNDGYVLFKIKTLETLELGDVFTSEANIYFDYNFPILTNTASTEVAESLSVVDFQNNTVKVYPNPTKDVLNISTTNSLINNILVTDINGRLVFNHVGGSDSSLELDLSSLSKGMYFVNVQTDSGSEIVKVVKQ